MLAFLTQVEIDIIISAVSLLVGVIFSTKIKDWFKGVPSSLRAALNNVEKDTVAKVQAAQAQIVAQLPGTPPAPKVALPPAAEPFVPTAPAA